MSKYVTFYSRDPYENFFIKIGKILREKYNLKILHIRELGDTKGEKVFQFEKWIKENWNDIDISYNNLVRLAKKYPKSNLMKILYSEREYNFYPKYFRVKPISYEEQLKYLVGCFCAFENFFDRYNINYFISELPTGLPHSVVYSICKKRAIRHISLRSSKLLDGIVMCDQDFDLPFGMLNVYRSFLKDGIPGRYRKLAESHISKLESKIIMPSYMQVAGKKFRLLELHRFRTFISLLRKKRYQVNNISRLRHPIRNRILWNIHRAINLIQTRMYKSRWFCKDIPSDEKYFLYPLQYEPEASTLVQAYPFSEQLFVIQQISKILPIGVNLIVKEHKSQEGYRKSEFYKELQYLPNVKLFPPETDMNSLINNSIGIITLTSRVGWEALVIGKPVIAIGVTFWTCFEKVKKPKSLAELKTMIDECVYSVKNNQRCKYYEKLLAYTAAYISCTYEGNFIPGSYDFLRETNIENIARAIFLELENSPERL